MSDNGGVTPQTGPEASNRQPDVRPGRHGGGVFLGVMLVVIGVLFLVPHFIPGYSAPWWALWPVIIIAGGVVQAFTPGAEGWGVDRVFDGAGTVVFGLVLLGNTTGYIAWNVWWIVVTLWPALVISAGLAILAQGLGQSWLRIAATLVIWLTLAYAVALSWSGGTTALPSPARVGDAGRDFSLSEPVRGATEARLRLAGGAGDIRLGSGRDLVSVEGSSPFGEPGLSVTRSGATARVDIGFNEPRDGATIVVPGMVGPRIDARLSDTVLWDVLLETGASSVDADLSEVRVRDLEVKAGASSVTLKLGDVPAGERTGTIAVRSGVSSVRILIPRDAEARFVTQTGLVASDVGGRFERRDGAWETPGYSSADESWDIRTEAGVGSVSVDTY